MNAQEKTICQFASEFLAAQTSLYKASVTAEDLFEGYAHRGKTSEVLNYENRGFAGVGKWSEAAASLINEALDKAGL